MIIKGFVGKEGNTLGTPEKPWEKIYAKELELENKTNVGVPVGSIIWYTLETPPDGFLVCNGAEISVETYYDLYGICGSKYGEAEDGKFKIPDLTSKYTYIRGGMSVGTTYDSGLPNIKGTLHCFHYAASGAFYNITLAQQNNAIGSASPIWRYAHNGFDASLWSSIYGNSEIVQPPSLTLLPCIKY